MITRVSCAVLLFAALALFEASYRNCTRPWYTGSWFVG
jgi:hypothetical protein